MRTNPLPMSSVKAQIDPGLKASAESTLKALGLDMTSAIRMFLNQVVMRGAIPFDVALPELNRTTLDAIADSYAARMETPGSVSKLFDSLDD